MSIGESGARRGRRTFAPLRVVCARPRLFSSLAVGIMVTIGLAALPDWRAAPRLLVGWDIGVTVYLTLAFEMMATSRVHRIRERAAKQDEGRIVILVLTVAAAVASLGAILIELGTSGSGPGGREGARLIVATLTIVLSWTFIHTMFALHYAHDFYGENAARGPGLVFPGDDPEPDYWDFVYFSFAIGMTSQVSDVGITAKGIRRTVAAHGIVAFMFNVALLALTVNIAASAI
jgi:uncharacterized membrane protein